MNSLILDFDY